MIFDNPLSICLLIFAAIFGGFIRRLSGFGGALIMTPLLMWVFPIPFLIPFVMCAGIFGGVLLSRQWKIYPEDRSRLWLMLLFAGIFLPLGIWLGGRIPPIVLKIATSAIVLFFASYLLLKPHVKLSSSGMLGIWVCRRIVGALIGILWDRGATQRLCTSMPLIRCLKEHVRYSPNSYLASRYLPSLESA